MDVPDSIKRFFGGAGGINIMASPRFLVEHTGIPRIYLPVYDIYHCGKDKTGSTAYTKYRILGKESVHNTLQGVLEMQVIDGYGIKDVDKGGFTSFLRPNDAKKIMTEGSTPIKRNSVIILKSGLLVRLEDVENFCDLPIIERTRLFESQTHMAISKRESYKMLHGTDNWAHVKRGALARDMERSVHKLLLPYYRKYRSDGDKDAFFKSFMEDLMVVCTAHHSNFTQGSVFTDVVNDIMSKGTKRRQPCLLNETRPRKRWGSTPTKDDAEHEELEHMKETVVEQDLKEVKTETQVKQALKNVSRSKIASIVF